MVEHPRVLLVDDERSLTDNLAPLLERAGFHVTVAYNGTEAMAKVAEFAPHIILLDVLMPGMDGREVLRRLREQDTRTAIIMLTKVGGADERGITLQEGADDYVNKPFSVFELVARMNAVLRRTAEGKPSPRTAGRLACGDLVFDRRAGCAYFRDKRLKLKPKTLGLLEYLLSHPNELLTRDQLLDALWGYDDPGGARMVDNAVWELRRVLKDDAARPRFIETVPARGYRFVGAVEALP